jgi:hypothetical protein
MLMRILKGVWWRSSNKWGTNYNNKIFKNLYSVLCSYLLMFVHVHVGGVRRRMYWSHKWAYCLSLDGITVWSYGGIIMTGEYQKDAEKNLSQCHLIINSTWTEPSANSVLRGERPATTSNCLIHDTALCSYLNSHGFNNILDRIFS